MSFLVCQYLVSLLFKQLVFRFEVEPLEEGADKEKFNEAVQKCSLSENYEFWNQNPYMVEPSSTNNGERDRLMEKISSSLKKDPVVRPRLDSWEMWTVYRLIDTEYWRCRRYQEKDDYFRRLSCLRRKLLKDLNACREDKVSIKQRV